MESTTTSMSKIELIQSAIQQLLDSRKADAPSTDDDDDHHLLFKLLSQVRRNSAIVLLDGVFRLVIVDFLWGLHFVSLLELRLCTPQLRCDANFVRLSS